MSCRYGFGAGQCRCGIFWWCEVKRTPRDCTAQTGASHTEAFQSNMKWVSERGLVVHGWVWRGAEVAAGSLGGCSPAHTHCTKSQHRQAEVHDVFFCKVGFKIRGLVAQGRAWSGLVVAAGSTGGVKSSPYSTITQERQARALGSKLLSVLS